MVMVMAYSYRDDEFSERYVVLCLLSVYLKDTSCASVIPGNAIATATVKAPQLHPWEKTQNHESRQTKTPVSCSTRALPD